jgi:tetratricopeptide (TPR) repeat protein
MNQGHSAAWDQKWEKAAGFYRQAIDISPDNATALTSYGLALFELKDFDEALGLYEKASTLSPNDPLPFEKIAEINDLQGMQPEAIQAYLQAADLYLKQRDVEKAIDNWHKVLAFDPGNLDAHRKLALVHERLDRKLDAVHEYISIASLMQHRGETSKAIELVDYALRLVPDHVDALQAKNALQGRHPLPLPEAPKPASSAPSKKKTGPLSSPSAPKSPKTSQDPIAEARRLALAALADLLFEQGDVLDSGNSGHRRGLSALTGGKSSMPAGEANRSRIQLHIGQAIELQSRGDFKKATSELSRAVGAGLNHAAAYFDLGLLQKEQNMAEEALTQLRHSVKHPDYALASYLLMAELYHRADKDGEAAAACVQALRLADAAVVPAEQAADLKQLYEPLIEAQSQETDLKTLRGIYKSITAQTLRPDWRQHLKAAREQLPQGSPDSPPVPLAEILLQTSSGEVIESLSFVTQLIQRDKTRSAMEEAFHTLQYSPTFLPMHTQIAEILMKEDQPSKAVDKFLLISQLYNLRGEAAQAARLLNKVTRVVPMDISIRKQLINLLAAQGEINEVLEQYMELANVYYQLAELDMARETYTEALRMTQRSRSNQQWNIKILTKLADIDRQRLDWRQAVRVLEQIRTLEPEDPDVRIELVDLNYRLGQEQVAMTEIDRFISLLANAGKHSVAIGFLGQVLDLMPDKVDLHMKLAQIYTIAGRREQAVTHLDMLANKLVDQDRNAEAIEVVEAIIKLSPSNLHEYQKALIQLRAR